MDTPNPDSIFKPKKPRKKPGKVGQNKSQIVADVPLACVDETAAVEFMERRRWGDCPACPRCGSTDVRKMLAADGKRNKRFLWRCKGGCGEQFTVRIGTVFEESRIPLKHWCYGFWAACASKKGVSAKQIQRQTGLSYKSSLFMMHRIRHAMAPSPGAPPLSGTVEVDETFCGGRRRIGSYRARDAQGNGKPLKPKMANKTPVMAAVQRDGQVRARVVPKVTAENVRLFLADYIDARATVLMTDENALYRPPGKGFAAHRVVNHERREYAKPDGTSTNTIESFFALLKRGLHGTFHSVSPEHLHRYVSEFEFRYNHRKIDDGERVELAIRAGDGKRLRYREPA